MFLSRIGLVSLLGLASSGLLVVACSGENSSTGARVDGLRAADATVADLDQRFGVGPTGWRTASRLPRKLEGGSVAVSLGATAARAFEIRDEASGMVAHARLVGAADASGEEAASGHVVYPHAYGDGDIVHAASRSGLEDLVYLPTAPTKPELRYELETAGIAGLRLINGALELLDAGGAPRLRVSAPWVTDAVGERHPLRLTVGGCASAERGLPWGRPVTPPGAERCEVRVSWAEDIAYPILVDPSWTTTAAMQKTRPYQTAVAIDGPKVLVIGADGFGGMPVPTAEVYDPASKTWASTSAPSALRIYATATRISTGPKTGQIFVAGGQLAVGGVGVTALASTEIYDPGTDKWTAAAPIPAPRTQHTASLLPGGAIITCGGANSGSPVTAVNTCHQYDPVNNLWASGPSMLLRHRLHAALVDTQGGLFVFGGQGGPAGSMFDGDTSNVESLSASWVMKSPMSQNRSGHAAHLLADGRMLVVGGVAGSNSPDIYTPASDKWAPGAVVPGALFESASSMLSNGCVLVAGGNSGNTPVSSATLFDPMGDTWTATTAMADARRVPTLTAFDSAHALVAGGFGANGMPLLTGAEFKLGDGGETCVGNCECVSHSCVGGVCAATMPDANGATCKADWECSSTHCAGGVCCKTACNGTCQACDATGTCGPAAAGMDPKSDCKDDGASSCGHSGSCDGKGACSFYAKGTECGMNGCSGASLVSAACNGSGMCTSTSEQCAPFKCDDPTKACLTLCRNIDDCTAPNVCDDQGRCVPPLASSGSGAAGGGSGDSGGCGCSLPGEPSDSSSILALLGLALIGLRRKARRTRR